MIRRLDVTGTKFGRLTALVIDTGIGAGTYWKCKCDCGNEKIVNLKHLRSSSIRSCGCLLSETKSGYKHGLTRTKEFRAWVAMKYRCLNPNCREYKHYGGAGITVHESWNGSFQQFLQDVGFAPTKLHSIDRIDVNSNYEPTNVRWVVQKYQVRNRTNTIKIIRGDEERSLAEWCEIYSLPYNTIKRRYYKGWGLPELFNPIKYATK